MIRLNDFLLSALGMLLMCIPMILIALWIRLSDGEPAMFRQTRVGKELKKFTVYKFRTMYVRQPRKGIGDVPSYRTQVGDTRITPIGRVLRPSHLDELPQLLNVLLGQMSLVGVRPDTPMQEADYSREYWETRHRLRPGITGPAQIASGNISLSERTSLETEWLENPSMGAYYKILLKTVAKVFAHSSN